MFNKLLSIACNFCFNHFIFRLGGSVSMSSAQQVVQESLRSYLWHSLMYSVNSTGC